LKPASPEGPLPARIRARLERQLQGISTRLAAAIRDKTQLHIDLPGKSHIEELKTLLAGLKNDRFSSIQAGPGMVLAAYRTSIRSLHTALAGTRSARITEFGDFDKHAAALRLSDSPFNALILSSLVYSGDFTPQLLPGTTPVFWWPLDIKLLRDLLFGRTTVMSVYNPAHLFARLEAEGFRVVHFRPPDEFTLEQPRGQNILRLERFQYFVRLACYALMSDQQVVHLLLRAIDSLPDQLKRPVRCDLELIHRLI
jgi:hypothetical protein